MRDLEIIERPQRIFHYEPQGKDGKKQRLCLRQLLDMSCERRNPVVQTFHSLRCKLDGFWLR